VKDSVALRTVRNGLGATGRVRRAGIEYAEAAVPLPGGQVLLFSSSLSDQLSTVSVIERRLLFATLVALGIALGLGSVAAALHASRIRRLDRAADRIAEGEFGEPIVDAARDELGELARSFDRMRVQLGTLDDARKAFVANASHELRTPLFSLAGFLELLADEELDEETRRGFLQTTREQVARLTGLATDLLDLSRLDAGRMRLATEDVELGEVARAVAEELGPVAETSGHSVSVEAPLALAVGDEERVVQAVRALARNAIVHTPSGTRVSLVTGVDGSRAFVDVTDDGPGIPADDRERIFQRFYRGDGRRASGSGLGLAIARELVERMHGTLTVESRPGTTRFRVSLPRDSVHST
jgi:signal transduction histidine kinase